MLTLFPLLSQIVERLNQGFLKVILKFILFQVFSELSICILFENFIVEG